MLMLFGEALECWYEVALSPPSEAEVLHRWLRHRRCIVRPDRGQHQESGGACR